jgi:anti-sigma factor RsiW
MMQCDLEPMKLAAYLDGEVPEAQAAAVRAHIAACLVCAAEVAEMVALKRGLLAARGRSSPSADFRARVRQQISAKKKTRMMPNWMWPALATVAAMLMISVAWVASSHRPDALSEVADLHVNMLASANPVDVISTDRHTVKPWFAGRIPFAFNVPEFAGSDFALLGGKVAYFDQQPGAQLLVSMKQHKVSVLIFKESPEMEHAFVRSKSEETRNGFNMETWSSGGLRFVVTGDTEPATLSKLAAMLRQANP